MNANEAYRLATENNRAAIEEEYQFLMQEIEKAARSFYLGAHIEKEKFRFDENRERLGDEGYTVSRGPDKVTIAWANARNPIAGLKVRL